MIGGPTVFRVPGSALSSLRFDLHTLVVAVERDLRVYSLHDGAMLGQISRAHSAAVSACDVASDAGILLSASADCTLRWFGPRRLRVSPRQRAPRSARRDHHRLPHRPGVRRTESCVRLAGRRCEAVGGRERPVRLVAQRGRPGGGRAAARSRRDAPREPDLGHRLNVRRSAARRGGPRGGVGPPHTRRCSGRNHHSLRTGDRCQLLRPHARHRRRRQRRRRPACSTPGDSQPALRCPTVTRSSSRTPRTADGPRSVSASALVRHPPRRPPLQLPPSPRRRLPGRTCCPCSCCPTGC